VSYPLIGERRNTDSAGKRKSANPLAAARLDDCYVVPEATGHDSVSSVPNLNPRLSQGANL
jgi:hypothetical protein